MQFVPILTCINILLCLLLFVETKVVVQPVYLDTNPQLSEAAEQEVIEVMKRVNTVIDQFMEDSSVVIDLVQQLGPAITSYQRSIIQERLRREFLKALEQAGIATEVAREFAFTYAYNIVRYIGIWFFKRGSSIVVYYICETVKALCHLGQMIMSGFLCRVFSAIIQLLASTTVDVIVRVNDFNIRLWCLTSTHGTGLYLDREQFNLVKKLCED